ncbi:sugar phosphate isomerase/epimerase [Candidatus Parcubacteria bacterium]|jgi:hexulose-6-phosphate isomerase|nr:MAG: sugar phosphate isomerase/epimerase [Candidatus Parcubacteria bacterium]
MKNPIGIMQGRLSPPVNEKIQAFPWSRWEQEFFQAKEIGLDLIDWIVEADKLYENPLLSTEGAKAIKRVTSRTGVSIGAVCADYFMDCPLIRCSKSDLKERINVLELLIDRLSHFKIKYLEMPFVDNSAIKDSTELKQIIQIIKPRLDKAYQLGVTLAFETSLPAEIFKTLLLDLNHPAARANYDTGNSASLGYKPEEELEAYGELVVTVHIKDRVLKGRTVPLGQGDTDFITCFSILRAKNYTGPFILQVARGGDEIELAQKNMLFVKNFLDR